MSDASPDRRDATLLPPWQECSRTRMRVNADSKGFVHRLLM